MNSDERLSLKVVKQNVIIVHVGSHLSGQCVQCICQNVPRVIKQQHAVFRGG